MTIPELSLEALFGSFPEPVLFLHGQEVRYWNPAAAALFPALGDGGALPEALGELTGGLEEPALAVERVGGRDWRISVQAAAHGRLVILRPVPPECRGHRTERLVSQLRQQTAGLSAAIQRLFPQRSLTEEKYRQYLELANQGLYRLLHLVDQLEFLDETEERVYRPGSLDLAGLCREVADEMEDVSRAAGWRFSYETDTESLLTEGDDALLRRLLMALLSNAVKATGRTGKFGLKLTRLRQRAVLTVWDNGVGLREEDMGFLFAGEDARRPALDPAEGAGLGLPAVRRVAALHGGTVMIESRAGEGFRAIVSLPVHRPEAGLPIRSRREVYTSESFSNVLMELSDVLPSSFYAPEEDI